MFIPGRTIFSVCFACWKCSVNHTYGTPKLTLWLAPGTTIPISLRPVHPTLARTDPHKTRSIHLLPNMYLRKPPCQFSGNSSLKSKICNPIRSELCYYSQRRMNQTTTALRVAALKYKPPSSYDLHTPPHTICNRSRTLHRKMKTNLKRNHTQHCHT